MDNLNDRLALIKSRHAAMIEDVDCSLEETAVAVSKRCDGDEELSPLDEQFIASLMGGNESFGGEKDYSPVGVGLRYKKDEEEDDLKWVANHRNISRGKCRNHPDVESDFIQALRDNRELAIRWFPELELLEPEIADDFLKSCAKGDWNEQHADRAVHFYKQHIGE